MTGWLKKNGRYLFIFLAIYFQRNEKQWILLQFTHFNLSKHINRVQFVGLLIMFDIAHWWFFVTMLIRVKLIDYMSITNIYIYFYFILGDILFLFNSNPLKQTKKLKTKEVEPRRRTKESSSIEKNNCYLVAVVSHCIRYMYFFKGFLYLGFLFVCFVFET